MLRLLVLIPLTLLALGADTVPQITPGKAVVPPKMRRLWGELISLDLKTRTGTFRNESNDEVMKFVVLPYAELLHHAAFGDLQDFRVGERAIFRLHENDKGEWVWLTYIQDEMNFLNNHKEYYWVDHIDAAKGQIEFTQANADKSFVRQKGLVLDTDEHTRFWKNGEPARFADIKVGDWLRTKTHGIGKGKTRMCWEVFLDDASLQKFQAEQQAVHKKRLTEEGMPGYLDSREGQQLRVPLFREAGDLAQGLKSGQKVRIAPAGTDRKPTAAATDATVRSVKAVGALKEVCLDCTGAPGEVLQPAGLVRLWSSNSDKR
jgi:hypothetical protein